MRIRIYLIASIVLLFSSLAYCCSDWGGNLATEVLLSNPEIEYDLSEIEEKTGGIRVKRPFSNSDGFAYASHLNDKVVVVIGIDSMQKPLPFIEEYEYPSKTILGLNIRIQIPYKISPVDMTQTVTVDVDPDSFDFQKAMEKELLWLKEVGIIVAISDEDIKTIVEHAKAGIAGEARRTVYDEGKWMRYQDIENAGYFIPRGDCGLNIELEEMMNVINLKK